MKLKLIYSSILGELKILNYQIFQFKNKYLSKLRSLFFQNIVLSFSVKRYYTSYIRFIFMCLILIYANGNRAHRLCFSKSLVLIYKNKIMEKCNKE